MKHPLREPKSGTLDDWDTASVRLALTYTAHAASMQLVFADPTNFLAEYRGDAFATMHGSWNRKPPSGYGRSEIVRIHFEAGEPKSIEPFVKGFLLDKGEGHWAVSLGRLVWQLQKMAAYLWAMSKMVSSGRTTEHERGTILLWVACERAARRANRSAQ